MAEKSILETAKHRLQVAIDATSQNRTYQLDDLKFAAASPDNGYQWPSKLKVSRESDPNGARPVLTINKLPQHINQVTNEQRQNRPSIKVVPVDDKSDPETAEILNGIIRHIENASDAEIAYDIGGENQVTHGEGYWRILADYCDEMSFDQDIQIAPIKNAFSVYMDPMGLQRDATGRYCEWALITDDITKDEFEATWPDKKPVSWETVTTGDAMKNWVTDGNLIRIAEYFYFKTEKKKLYLWADGSVSIEGDEQASALHVAEKPLKTRETQVKKLQWAKVSGFEVLEERELVGKYIPVVRVAGNEWYIDGKMVVSGIVRNAKDAQRMFNYWKSQETEMLALAPKAPFMASVEAIAGYESLYKTANTTNHAYLPFNAFNDAGEPIPMPQRSLPPMPPVGIVQAALGAADDIKSATGQYDPSLGNNPQAKSGIALKQEQRKSDVGTFHYIDNQARAIRQTGRILLEWIPAYYDTERVARILGEDGTPDHVTLNPNLSEAKMEITDESGAIKKIYNPNVGKYDVTVSVGPSYASKRQEAAEGMVQLVNTNPELWKVIGDLLVRNLDWPGAEEMAERIKKAMPPEITKDDEGEGEEPVINTPQGPLPISQAGAAFAQMLQQMEQMGAALEQADMIGKQAEARRLEIEAMDAETRRMDAETKRMEVESKDKERQFNATVQYVDRTAVDDTQLLAPAGVNEGVQP